ncbi:glycerol-3-phosphate 1-O-acyltransferase [bacterium]|nr:MAG: glycerol-3-phosphate 1-O-acyltransferase [bacterium]
MLQIILAITASYLIGSIPTAYIFGRVLKGIDIRKLGSGNVGATNAMRVLGKWPGIIVLIIDILKGFFPVVLLINFIKIENVPVDFLLIVLGISCILGHTWTIFLNFKGGKGMATTLGVLIGMATKIPGLSLVLGALIFTWVIVFIIFRIVSLASVTAALLFPLYVLFFNGSRMILLLSIILSAFIIYRHKSNLKRLSRGEEPRLKTFS